MEAKAPAARIVLRVASLVSLVALACVFVGTGTAAPTSGPNDPFFQAGFGNWPFIVTKFDQAWPFAQSTDAPVIAVIDTAVNASEPDLAGSVLPGYDVITGLTATSDDSVHGTAVASIIAAHRNNGIGGAGVCDGCKILPVRVLDATEHASDAHVAQGITWAVDHGARILNISLGGTREVPLEAAAVAYAESKNVLVVASAGNDGNSETYYPAAFPGVLSVGAVDALDAMMTFSNFGPNVDVVAPGCAIGPEADSYNWYCGTSFAAPFVAGLAGMILAAQPNLTALEVKAMIESSSKPNPGLNSVHGRIDALAALKLLGVVNGPVSATAPVLSGAARSGQTLHAYAGAWKGQGLSYSYRWQRSANKGATWTSLAATTSSYKLGAADLRRLVRVQVTATNTAGRTTASSKPSALVA